MLSAGEYLLKKQAIARIGRNEMTALSTLTDRQLERKIVEILHGTENKDINEAFDEGEFAFTKNPSGIMPLVIALGISLVYMRDYWSAHWLNEENDEDCEATSENPYRALTECVLRVLGDKNEPRMEKW